MQQTFSEYYLKKKGLKSFEELSTAELTMLKTVNEWQIEEREIERKHKEILKGIIQG
jgi:hypothetical protein